MGLSTYALTRIRAFGTPKSLSHTMARVFALDGSGYVRTISVMFGIAVLNG